MKWREAVLLSANGVAVRDNSSNYKEPRSACAWYSRRGRFTVQILSAHRHKGRVRPRRLSTAMADQFDDWEPMEQLDPLNALAVGAMIDECLDDRQALSKEITKKLRRHSASKKRRRDREPPTQLLLRQLADDDL